MNTREERCVKVPPRLSRRQATIQLSEALRKNVSEEEDISRVVEWFAVKTKRSTRTIWRYIPEAKKINAELSHKEETVPTPEPVLTEPTPEPVLTEVEMDKDYIIDGVSIFDERFEQETIERIGSLIKYLHTRIQLTSQDAFSLHAAASAFNSHVMANNDILEYGMFVEEGKTRKVNPAKKMSDDSLKICMEILKRYGCSPYDRQRIDVLKAANTKKSAMDMFMEQGEDD
ncbi:MAG: P27 family phage terminase small subunit [Tannerellaceae bacterium]|jgi:phage terminase small subunit|nr:P27 family phage terminase small subunit [Tannerellaceae bacterium]